jgi:hypothetical protein
MSRAPFRSLQGLAAAAAIAAAIASPSRAAAEDPNVAKAQALFAEGRTALEKGDFTAACAKFNGSLALVERASTLLNLAQCEEKLGKLTGALKHWKTGIALLPAGDPRLAISKERAAALEARVPRLSGSLGPRPPAGARVEIDGLEVPLEGLAAGVPLDPGRHVVAVFGPGGAEQRTTVDLVEKERRTVSLSISAPAEPPPAAPSATRGAGFAVLGVGLASGVLAGITGGMLVAKNASIQKHCDVIVGGTHYCDATGRSLIDGAGPLKVVNAIGWGVGLAGVAAGVTMIVVGGKAQASVAPTALPGGGGALVTGRF